jgi:LemA protein
MGWITLILLTVIAVFLVYKWVVIFNDFQFLYNKASQKLNDVNIFLKQRLDNVTALATLVQRYSEHEYNTISDTIKNRGSNITDEVIEKGLINVKAVQEQYPELKANALFESLMDKDSEIESQLKDTRKEYNRIIQEYNTQTVQFPRNIVAKLHGFTQKRYYNFPETPELKEYKPQEIMMEVK